MPYDVRIRLDRGPVFLAGRSDIARHPFRLGHHRRRRPVLCRAPRSGPGGRAGPCPRLRSDPSGPDSGRDRTGCRRLPTDPGRGRPRECRGPQSQACVAQSHAMPTGEVGGNRGSAGHCHAGAHRCLRGHRPNGCRRPNGPSSFPHPGPAVHPRKRPDRPHAAGSRRRCDVGRPAVRLATRLRRRRGPSQGTGGHRCLPCGRIHLLHD